MRVRTSQPVSHSSASSKEFSMSRKEKALDLIPDTCLAPWLYSLSGIYELLLRLVLNI